MEFVDQLKSSVDIAQVIGQYVPLKRVGPDRYMGKCPFHTEKTPSFSVHGGRQWYHCFGCSARGDVIRFVMEIEGLSFYEALKALADRHGIPMPRRSEYSDPETKLRASLYRMHEIALEIFRRNLSSGAGAEARAYIEKRGISKELVEEFGLGYADRSGQTLVRTFTREGFDAAQMEESGLVKRRNDGSGFFDMFRGRLIFPIHNETGKTIGFGGRALTAEDEPKYLNSPETKIYRKTHVVYNLHRAKESIRKNGRSVLVEGYMDVIAVYGAGVKEAVASCGTALTGQQVKAVHRHADAIIVNFDADAAGIKAAERSIELLLGEGMQVRVLELGGGLDPDEYIKAHGAAAYGKRLESVPGYFHWLADRARAKYDMKTTEGRIAGLKFLLPAIQHLSDKLERAAVANDVATYLGVEQGMVLEQFRKMAADRREEPIKAPRDGVRPLEKILLNSLLGSVEARRELAPRLKDMPALEQFATRRILETMFALSENKPDFSFAELDARLQENDRDLLAAVAFSGHDDSEGGSLEQARACLRKLEDADLLSRRASLRSRIKEAEREGKMEEALQWMAQLAQLDRG